MQDLLKSQGPARSRFLSRIDLMTLSLFVAVDEEASIARAAEREHLAPSAVSKRLAELEQVMKVPLLDRHRRGVTLTAAGKVLTRHSRRILHDLSQMECEMSEFYAASFKTRGHVRAAGNESALFGFFPNMLGRFSREHPHITIDLAPDTSTGVVQRVREGAADVGIFWGEQPVDGMRIMSCYVDRLVVVVPQDHALVESRGVRFSDLLDYPFIRQERHSSIQTLTDRLAAEAGRTLRSSINVVGFDAVCRMVQAGLGIGVVPDYFVTDRATTMHIAEVALAEPWANRLHKLCVREHDEMSTATRLFVEFLVG